MWGARAACSGAVDYLRRCAPPVDTAPLRSLAPCLPYRSGSKQPPLQRGCLPSRSCSATAAPRLPDRSRATIRAPHAINNVTLCAPDPLAETPPLWGGLTARIMCGCGRARRARLRGLRCQRCAQTRTVATLRGAGYDCKHCVADRCDYAACVWPCPPPGAPAPVWRLRCAWPAGAWSHAHRISAIVLGAMGYGGYVGARCGALNK